MLQDFRSQIILKAKLSDNTTGSVNICGLAVTESRRDPPRGTTTNNVASIFITITDKSAYHLSLYNVVSDLEQFFASILGAHSSAL